MGGWGLYIVNYEKKTVSELYIGTYRSYNFHGARLQTTFLSMSMPPHPPPEMHPCGRIHEIVHLRNLTKCVEICEIV